MECYRFFGVSALGHIVSDRSFDCEDDSQARSMAAALIEDDRGIEVWDAGRCVFKIACTLPDKLS